MNKEVMYIIISGILWGIIAIFVKGLSSMGFTSIEIVALRVWFSAICLIIFLLFKDYRLLKIKISDLWLFIGTGLVSIVFFNYCYFYTISKCSISIAAFLLYTAPVIVMILSVLILKEKMNISKSISLIMACVGLAFITGVIGYAKLVQTRIIIIGIGAGFGYAMYSIFGKLLVSKYNAYTITTYTFIVASIGISPLISPVSIVKKTIDFSAIYNDIGVSILCTVLPFLLYTKALEKEDSGKASIIATVEPIVATIIGVAIYNEKITVSKLVGILLIIFSIVVLNIKVKNKKEYTKLDIY